MERTPWGDSKSLHAEALKLRLAMSRKVYAFAVESN